MFCYQREFRLPTEAVTQELFHQLVDSPQTRWLTREHRRWREQMPSILADEKLQEEWARDEEYQKWCYSQENDHRFVGRGKNRAQVFRELTLAQRLQGYCDHLKKSLPFVIFIATYDESVSAKSKLTGRWRNQKYCRLNGLCVIDFDHVDSPAPDGSATSPSFLKEGVATSVRQIWAEAYARLSDEDQRRILLVYVTPSGHGLKVVFIADSAVGNLIDNQMVFSRKLGLNPDEACKDASRGAFLTTRDDIIMLNEEKLITYESEDFGKKYDALYHAGHSQPTVNRAARGADGSDIPAAEGAGADQPPVSAGDGKDVPDAESLTYNGVPYPKIIEAWLDGMDLTNKRHDTLVQLTDHLRYVVGKNPTRITEVVMQLPWVQQLAAEGEDVAGTVSSIMGWTYRRRRPDRLVAALRRAGAEAQSDGMTGAHAAGEDVYGALPLDEWAGQLQEMAQHYPCLQQLFLNVHPQKLPAVWFSSAALFGTLMTRAYYHFWYDPEIVRRLNYCIFIIGDPGAGKNIVEKFYKKIADPMIQADQCLIDAVNRYKEGRTERTTSTKAQKGEVLKRPVVGIRVHPARTATGEFIRHMNAAVETVGGEPLNLHMFSFDAELDNVNKNNKGGDWKDREILELKAFHNEQDGQMYANQESVTGMFNVFWNFIYTGTPYALHRKVNQRNFGTGMSTRLAVIPLPDKGLAKRSQRVDPTANETLRMWAYRLDRVEGELPIESLNDETYDWQSSHMEIAEFNGDKADRTLLKRIPYYGIAISVPFILMRHWDEWQQHRSLTIDDRDRRLCRLAMDIQYRCQQFYFGEMAYNYFADQYKEFVQRRRSTRYEECFRKLPDHFKTQQFMDCFGISQSAASRAISRLQNDGMVAKVKYGVYHKMVAELP